MYVVRERAVSIHASGALSRAAVTGASGIDDVLHDGGVHKAEATKHESDGNASNGLELDLELAKDRVDNHVENGNEDDDRNRIKVLHKIIGHAVTLHLASLGDEVARELGVADPENRVEAEDLARHQSTLELVNKVIVPCDGLGLAVGRTPRGLSSVGVAGNDHQTDGLESVGNNRSLRWANDVVLLGHDQDDDTDAEHEEAHEVCSPEALVHLHEWCSEERETSHVNASVEHHVDPLEGNRGIDNDTLTGLRIS